MARTRRGRDLVDVAVLAFLWRKPQHPYELHRFVLDTHKDFITGLPRSLYHAVDRLTRDDLIEPLETTREGRRPERTVYQITEEGKAELASRLRRMLEQPDRDTTVLLAAVSLMGCLCAEDVARSLRTRVAVLEGAVAGAGATLSGLRAGGLPRLLLLEVECERALLAAELDWVRGLLADLESGELSWPGLRDSTYWSAADAVSADGAATGETAAGAGDDAAHPDAEGGRRTDTERAE